jgi:hypothetical protein
MRENEPVLLVLSVCDGEIILEKGEILCEKCQLSRPCSSKGVDCYEHGLVDRISVERCTTVAFL